MNREELINEVLNQILQDVKDFDLTALSRNSSSTYLTRR
jgi:hypothetical protein